MRPAEADGSLHMMMDAMELRPGQITDDSPDRCEGPSLTCVLDVNLLDPLDPDAVVGDVEIVEDVGRLVLSEDLVDVKQAFEDAGFPWAWEDTGAGGTLGRYPSCTADNTSQLLADPPGVGAGSRCPIQSSQVTDLSQMSCTVTLSAQRSPSRS